MKGRTLVIGIVLFVLIVVGFIYLAMMSTINKIKEENDRIDTSAIIIEHNEEYPVIEVS